MPVSEFPPPGLSELADGSAGIGVRVIVDKKQGFAYAGSLDVSQDPRAQVAELGRDLLPGHAGGHCPLSQPRRQHPDETALAGLLVALGTADAADA